MKGNTKLIEQLNQLLSEELTAISQYMVHSEMCDNWGLGRLHKAIEKQAIDEMHHAEWLIGRIIFLEGTPNASKLNPMKIGKTVPEIIAHDKEAELAAVAAHNAGIRLAAQEGDEGSAELMRKILEDEERHEDWNEAQQDQMGQMGVENYLSTQTEG
ncbi:MAG: bacterioferritin [Chloroflexota bacterium]